MLLSLPIMAIHRTNSRDIRTTSIRTVGEVGVSTKQSSDEESGESVLQGHEAIQTIRSYVLGIKCRFGGSRLAYSQAFLGIQSGLESIIRTVRTIA
jgi:hypothetical protein